MCHANTVQHLHLWGRRKDENMPFQMYKCAHLKRCQKKAKIGMEAGFNYPKYGNAQSEHNNEAIVQG